MRATLFAPGSRSSLDIETGFWTRDPGDNHQAVADDFDRRFELLRERSHEGLHWRQLRGTSLGIMLTHMAFFRNRVLPQACAQPGNLAIVQHHLRRHKPLISAAEYRSEELDWEFDAGGENGASKAKWIGYDKLYQALLASRCPCADSQNPHRLKVFINDFVREFGQLVRHPQPFGNVETDTNPLALASMTVSEEEMERYFLSEDRPTLVELLEFSAIINEIGHTYIFAIMMDDLLGKGSPYVQQHRREKLDGSIDLLARRLKALSGTSYVRPLEYISRTLGVEVELTEPFLRTLLAIGMCIDIALNPALPPATTSRFGTYVTLSDVDAVGRLGLILAKNRDEVVEPKFDISLKGASDYRSRMARAANLTWTDEVPRVSLPDNLYAEYLHSFDRDDSSAEAWAQGSHGVFLINSLIYEGILRLKLEYKLGYLSDDVFGFRASFDGETLRLANILADPEVHANVGRLLKYLTPIVQFFGEGRNIDFGVGTGWHEETCFLLIKLSAVLDATYDIMMSGEVSFLRGSPATLSHNLTGLRMMLHRYYGVG